jgi:hypothetical protein
MDFTKSTRDKYKTEQPYRIEIMLSKEIVVNSKHSKDINFSAIIISLTEFNSNNIGGF